MASRLTDTAKTLLNLCKRAFRGLPADVAEPEGPFINEEEQGAYDLLRTLTDVQQGPVVITTYSATLQSYTTTTSDLSAKCGVGTTASSVTRTSSVGTSTISQAAANAKALAAAKTAALAAIVCPVVVTPPPTTYTASYTTTAGDLSAKCGAGTTASGVTRTATSQLSQADANTKAKEAAVASIVCPVVVPTKPLLIAFDGNSGLANASGNPFDFSGTDVPAQIVASLTQQGYNVKGCNVAVNGQTTRNMMSDVATQVDPLATDSAYSRHILMVTEWSNDVTVGGADPDDAYASFVRYCRDRQAAGWEVVISNILPRASYLGSMTVESFAAARSEVNLLLVNNWRGYASNLADLTKLTLTQPDGTHPDAAGYTLIAGEMGARIREVIDYTVPAQTSLLPPAHFATFSGNGAMLQLPTKPTYKSIAFYMRAQAVDTNYPARGVFIAGVAADYSQFATINVELPIGGAVGQINGVPITDTARGFGTSNWVAVYLEGFINYDICSLLSSPVAFDGDYRSIRSDLAAVAVYDRLWTNSEKQNNASAVIPDDYVAFFDFQNVTGNSVPDKKGGKPATLGSPLPIIS